MEKKKEGLLIIALMIFIININLIFAVIDENSADKINKVKPILSNNIPILSNQISPSIDSFNQPKGFDLSHLSDSQVKELANLNLEKINIKKKIEKLKFNLNKQRTQGSNSLNPFLAIMNYINENEIKSEEKNLVTSTNNLDAVLTKYNVPIEVQNELDKINTNSGTWQNIQTVANKQITIPAQGSYDFKSDWNSANVKPAAVGDYRVYANFTSGIQVKETSYEFKVQ